MATLPYEDEDDWSGGPASHDWPLGSPRHGEVGLRPSLIETYLSPAGLAAREDPVTPEPVVAAPPPAVTAAPVADPLPLSRSERIREATRAKRRRVNH